MARRKISLEHNAVKCLTLPSYSHRRSFHINASRLPERCYLSTSHAKPGSRTDKQPNPHNVLQPPLTHETLKFVAPEVDIAVIRKILDAFAVQGDWERGCCLIHGSKTNDKFDIECSYCFEWYHSSCIHDKYRVKSAEITRIKKLIKSKEFKNEKWKCPKCVDNGCEASVLDENRNNNVRCVNVGSDEMDVDELPNDNDNVDVVMDNANGNALPPPILMSDLEPTNVSNVRPRRRRSSRIRAKTNAN